jgi:uncharacterized metal-binding protein YceD (DUF177 family)
VKIHLKQIPAQGLHLEGEEDCPIPELEADGTRCTGPLRYKIDVGLSGHALWANGSLAQPVEVNCVSCLEKFPYEIKAPAFAVHLELEGPETVDLTPLIREDILLNVPAYPHCDREGGRICNSPTAKADQEAEAIAAERKRQADWAALDKLKVEKK